MINYEVISHNYLLLTTTLKKVVFLKDMLINGSDMMHTFGACSDCPRGGVLYP